MGEQKIWAKRLKAWLRHRGGKAVKRITEKTGYNADQLAAGVQLATGLFVLLASLSNVPAWTACTLANSAITPVYAVVTFIVVLQPNLGTASQFVLMRVAGAVAGGLAGLACSYLTLAANGGTYENTRTKGAVMVSLLSVCTFFFSLLRFRHPRWWFAFTVATFSMPMVALNPYYLDYVEHRALFYWWLQISLGVGTAALVSTFVFPVTAGGKVQAKTAEVMRQLAGLTSDTVRCMVELKLGQDGLPVGLTGVLDGLDAADTGLSDAFRPLHETASSVSSALTQIKALLNVVHTEWNVYSSAHTFPREAYAILYHISRAYLSALLSLLYPLQSGRIALRAVQRMGPEFQKAADLLAACLRRAADCVGDGGSYEEALGTLRLLEDRWHLLGALCPVLNSSWGENEVLSSDMLVGTLFSLGTRVRRVYFALPEALHRAQPGARQAAFLHFRRTRDTWDLTHTPGPLRQRAMARVMTPRVDPSLSSLPRLLSPRQRLLQQQQQQAADNGQEQQSDSQPSSSAPSPFRHWLSPRTGDAIDRRSPFSFRELLTPRRQLNGEQRQQQREREQQRTPRQQQQPQMQGQEQQTQQRQQEQQQAADGGRWAADVNGTADATPRAAAGGRDPPKWHHVPSLHLREESLWQPPDAATLAERFPPTLHLPAEAPAGLLLTAARAVQERTGFTAEHAALALQLAVAMAAACTLHVTRESYEALHEKTIWAVVTVAVVLESAVGGLILKSGLRIIGTSGAGFLGIGLMGLVYLINGLSYANDPAKFIAMTALLPAVAFWLMINHVRFAVPYGYMWSCCKFTTPIIALSGYSTQVAIWQTAVFRAINILLGIGLDLVAATAVLPVTSRKATKHRVQEVLEGLGDLAETVILEFSRGEEEGAAGGSAAAAAAAAQQTAAGSTPVSPQRGTTATTPRSARPALLPGAHAPCRSRQRVPSLPRTPLSTAEATEIAMTAAAEAAAGRRERTAEREAEREAERAEREGEVALSQRRSSGLSTLSFSGSQETGAASLPPGSAKHAPAEPSAAAAGRRGSGIRGLFRSLPRPWRAPAASLPQQQGRWQRSGGSTPTAAHTAPAESAGVTAEVELRSARPAAATDGSDVATPMSGKPAANGGCSQPGSPCSWGRLPSCPSPLPPADLDIPPSPYTAALPQPGTDATAAGAAAANSAALGMSSVSSGSSGGPSPALPPPQPQQQPGKGSSAVGAGGSPQRPPPLQLPLSAPARQPRRLVSLAPDLPTVVSQQVLNADELPVLPPLNIPAHRALSIAEEPDSATLAAADVAAATTAGTAGAGAGSTPVSPRAMLSPFASSAQAEAVAGAASSGGRAAGTPSGAASARRLLPLLLLRRPSTSSTVFWLGTPRTLTAKRSRSRWLHERALGKSFMSVHQLGAELAATIAHMHELELFARFEWSPLERPHRMPSKDIRAAQHACRKLLNVLLSFAYLADSPDVPHRRLLMPMPSEVRAVAEQMGEALRALSLVLDGKLSVDTALEMVFNLQMQVQLLLLEVEQAAQAAVDVEAADGRADAVLGVAALGIMFSATQTVQLLYRCVLRLLGTPHDHAAAEEAFAQSAAWGASVEAILVARGVVLSSLVTADSEEVPTGPGAAAQAAAYETEARVAMEAGTLARGD